MFEIYLTDLNSPGQGGERVAELLTVESSEEASEICIAMQRYLRDGIEAHFVSA